MRPTRADGQRPPRAGRALAAAGLSLALACGEPPAPAATVSPEGAPPPRGAAEARPPEARTVLWIGGDVLPAGAIRRSVAAGGGGGAALPAGSGGPSPHAAAGFARLLEPVASRWREDGPGAFVVVNLETPVAATLRAPNDSYTRAKVGARLVRAPLNAEPWLLEGLRQAGVDGVVLSNNHTLDQGREGLAETLAAVAEAGLVPLGAGRAPRMEWPAVVGDEGARTAILAFFEKDFPEPTLSPGEAGLSVLGPASEAAVRQAAEDHDAVVVTVHVVAELVSEVKPRWRAWAAALAEAGADAILVHGTHVVAPVETVRAGGREVAIAYSLGNLVSDMGARATPHQEPGERPGKWEDPATRAGLVARVEVGAAGVTTTFLPVWMGNTRFLVHNRASDDPVRFEVWPLAPCGEAYALDAAWREPLRGQMLAWLAGRRDALLATSGLLPGCDRPGASLLPAPPVRGTM